MKKLTKILRKEEKGFTLIELIVVIAILGIIAAIAVPQFNGVVKNAKIKADQATAQVVADAAARYMTDNSTDSAPSIEELTGEGKYISSDPTWQIAGATPVITASSGVVTVTVSATGYPDDGKITAKSGYSD